MSSIFCFSTLSSIAESWYAVARDGWLPRPDSVPYNGSCKCLAREIEVIMRVSHARFSVLGAVYTEIRKPPRHAVPL